MVVRAGIHKLLVRIATKEDPDQMLLQKHYDLGLHCLSRHFWQAISVRNLRTFIIFQIYMCMFVSLFN